MSKYSKNNTTHTTASTVHSNIKHGQLTQWNLANTKREGCFKHIPVLVDIFLAG